jgi:RNA polymerase sigma factor (TIGR02999 family)
MQEPNPVSSAAGVAVPNSSSELLPQLYAELRQLAAQHLAHEPPGQTLQATALVHEAWLRLLRGNDRTWNDPRHFFCAAAQAMRRILIENARRKQRIRHGGELQRVNLDDINPASPMKPEELLALNEALERLAAEDPDAARLVELRFFAGLGHQEAAEVMGISRGIADELWAYARTWLYVAMQEGKSETQSRP